MTEKTIPCGGCGETQSSKRCIGCFHDFGDEASAWVRNARAMPKPPYECPVCGSNDKNRYIRCQHAGCPDGRDPR